MSWKLGIWKTVSLVLRGPMWLTATKYIWCQHSHRFRDKVHPSGLFYCMIIRLTKPLQRILKEFSVKPSALSKQTLFVNVDIATIHSSLEWLIEYIFLHRGLDLL